MEFGNESIHWKLAVTIDTDTIKWSNRPKVVRQSSSEPLYFLFCLSYSYVVSGGLAPSPIIVSFDISETVPILLKIRQD
jgi:hypothetical protein